MRIVFLIRRYWPARGGVETFAHHVATALAERHEVEILAYRIDEGASTRTMDVLGGEPLFSATSDGRAAVRQIRLSRRQRAGLLPLALQAVPGPARFAYGPARIPLSRWYGAISGRSLIPRLRGADVVHCWSADLLAAAALHAARDVGRPLVITPFVHPGQWGSDPGSQRIYRCADRVVGLVENERQLFRAMGVAEDRIAVCGVCSPGVPRGGGDRLRAEHGIKGPLVVFLGVRRPYKGVDLLRRAATLAAFEHPGLTVAFVGPGEPVDQHDTGGARLLDIGPVDEIARGSWLEAADLMCLPSDHEIFPVSLLEAFSAETPALLSDLPSLDELARRSGGAVTAERTPTVLAHTMSRLLSNRAQLRHMGASGHAFWVSGYTPAAVATAHERVYREAIRAHLRG